MTYAAYETSVQDGRPVELYDFVRNGEHTRYTSQSRDYDYAGHVYVSEAIGRTEVEQTNELAKMGIKVTFPRSNAFALGFIGTLHESVTVLTVWRGHVGDPDSEFEVVWKGRVQTAGAEGAEITLECESIHTSVKRMGLRARYQKPCRHTLYGRGCNLDKADWAVPATVTAADGVTLTVTEAALQADGWYTGGMVGTADGGLRFIMDHVGDQITLSRASESVLADVLDVGSASVNLYPGCAHDLDTCASKFNNHLANGGFFWIPSKNPMGGSSIV